MTKKDSATSVQAVANYFLDKAEQENRKDMTNLKIQKLVYIAYGYHSAFSDIPLFINPIQAWRHGPVIPSLYYEAKIFGSNQIIRPFTHIIIKDEDPSQKTEFGDINVEVIIPKLDGTDSFVEKVLNKVWEIYSEYTGWALRNLTHKVNTPWDKVFKNGDGEYQPITFDEISEYYVTFFNQYIENENAN